MASYLRPRRGTKSAAETYGGTGLVLKAGEIFFEVPDEGVGKGSGNIKMGDGSTTYANLPYFMKANASTGGGGSSSGGSGGTSGGTSGGGSTSTSSDVSSAIVSNFVQTDTGVSFDNGALSNAIASIVSGTTVANLFGLVRTALAHLYAYCKKNNSDIANKADASTVSTLQNKVNTLDSKVANAQQGYLMSASSTLKMDVINTVTLSQLDRVQKTIGSGASNAQDDTSGDFYLWIRGVTGTQNAYRFYISTGSNMLILPLLEKGQLSIVNAISDGVSIIGPFKAGTYTLTLQRFTNGAAVANTTIPGGNNAIYYKVIPVVR